MNTTTKGLVFTGGSGGGEGDLAAGTASLLGLGWC